MKRILIIKMWAIGDILMATPLLRALKAKYPDSSISWLVDTRYAGAIQNNVLVDEVIEFDSSAWRRDFRYGNMLPYLNRSFKIHNELRRRNFDLAICLTPDKWWCLWFNTARESIGLFPSDNPGFVGRFYSSVIPLPSGPKLHNTDHYLRPMQVLGDAGPYDRRMVFTVPAAIEDEVDHYIRQRLDTGGSRQIAILHPGTSQKTKCWPTKNFAELADMLSPHMDIIITGSSAEHGLAEEIMSFMHSSRQAVIAAGALSTFGHTGALVKRAFVVVTGDTSLLHLASCLDTPVVAIYGSTRPNDNAPLFGRNVIMYDDAVACAPCYMSSCPKSGQGYLACQKAITPAMVYENVMNICSVDVDGALIVD